MTEARFAPRRRRGWLLAAGVIGLVWVFRGIVAVVAPDNPNPYLNPLAVGVTAIAALAPLLRTARFGASRLTDATALLGVVLVGSAALIELLPATGGAHRGALLAHLVAGLLILLPLHLMLVTHLGEAVRRKPVALVRGGAAALAVVLGCAWSGAILLLVQAKQMSPLEQPHRATGWLLVLAAALHVRAGRAVLIKREDAPRVARRAWTVAALGLAILVAAVATGERGPAPWEAAAGPMRPGQTLRSNALTTTGTLLADGPENWSPATCSSPGGYCHVDNVTQWARSTHARSANPAFEAVLELFEADRPGKSSYCFSCHAPRRALTDAVPIERAPWPRGTPTADPSRPDGPPHGFERADDVGCAVCHRATPRDDVEGTASYRLAPLPAEVVRTGAIPFFNFPMVLAELDAHRDALLDASHADETGCATCHLHVVPDAIHPVVPGLLAADKVGPWRAWEAGEERCQDCHMPRVYGPIDPTWTRSHAFPSGNTGGPWLRGDRERIAEVEAFLEDRLVLGGGCSGGGCRVEVRNEGVGHGWPAGPGDLVQSWLHLVAQGADGRVVLERGGLVDGLVIEPLADWRLRLFDADGAPLDRHEFWDAARVEGRERIAPGTAQVIEFELPPDAVSATITLEQRRYTAAFVRELLPDAPGLPPVTQLARLDIERGPDPEPPAGGPDPEPPAGGPGPEPPAESPDPAAPAPEPRPEP